VAAATTIVNAKVFDGTRSRDWTSVRFADGLITKCSAAPAAQAGDEVIDAGGGTVLPGLIDAHVHLVPGALAQSLTFGVTTVLDMFSKPDLVARAKEQARSRPDVADVRSSGVGATAPGGHPSMMYAPFPTLTAADQAGQRPSTLLPKSYDHSGARDASSRRAHGASPVVEGVASTAIGAAAGTCGIVTRTIRSPAASAFRHSSTVGVMRANLTRSHSPKNATTSGKERPPSSARASALVIGNTNISKFSI